MEQGNKERKKERKREGDRRKEKRKWTKTQLEGYIMIEDYSAWKFES